MGSFGKEIINIKISKNAQKHCVVGGLVAFHSRKFRGKVRILIPQCAKFKLTSVPFLLLNSQVP